MDIEGLGDVLIETLVDNGMAADVADLLSRTSIRSSLKTSQTSSARAQSRPAN
jgi:hypothetical protein